MGYLKLASRVQHLEQESNHFKDRNKELNRQILILKDNNARLTHSVDLYAKEKHDLGREKNNLAERNEALTSRVNGLMIGNESLYAAMNRLAKEKQILQDRINGLCEDNTKLADENRVLKSEIRELEETASEADDKSDQIFQKIGEALGLQGKIFEDWSFCSIFEAINEMDASALCDASRFALLERRHADLVEKYNGLTDKYMKAADRINELIEERSKTNVRIG